jgi:hypothetical protein
VAIPLTVVGRDLVENAAAFTVNRLKELIPTVRHYPQRTQHEISPPVSERTDGSKG